MSFFDKINNYLMIVNSIKEICQTGRNVSWRTVSPCQLSVFQSTLGTFDTVLNATLIVKDVLSDSLPTIKQSVHCRHVMTARSVHRGEVTRFYG